MLSKRFVLVVAALSMASCPLWAESSFLTQARNQYPQITGTRLDSCTLCHTSVPSRNAYGSAWRNNGRSFLAIEGLDSDGDSFSNIDEIDALTFPGDAGDFPALAEGEGEGAIAEGEGMAAEGEGEGAIAEGEGMTTEGEGQTIEGESSEGEPMEGEAVEGEDEEGEDDEGEELEGEDEEGESSEGELEEGEDDEGESLEGELEEGEDGEGESSEGELEEGEEDEGEGPDESRILALQSSMLAQFDVIDQNGNGSLSLAEAQAHFADITQAEFNALDQDGNGALSLAELGGTDPVPTGCTLSAGKKRLRDYVGDLLLIGLSLGALSITRRSWARRG